MTGGGAGHLVNRPERSREPLTRAERILIGMFAALLGSGVVGFIAISGQLVGTQRQIGGLRTEMHRAMGDLREEIRGDIGKLSERVSRLETRLPTRGPSGS